MASRKKKVFWTVLALLALCGAAAGGGAYVFLHHRVEGAFFDSNGVRIHFTDEGAGDPLVLIHGFGMNADTHWRYRGVHRQLVKDYRVIALDCRGHGLSGKPHDPAQYGAEMAHDVARLLDHLRIAKAHIVGYSMGGFITLKFLTLYPERVICAVPGAAGWEEPAGGNLEALETLAKSLDQDEGFAPLARRLEPGGREPGALKIAAMNYFLSRANDEAALSAVARGFRGLAVTEAELRANTVPVLSIVGSEDPLRTGIDAMTGVMANHETYYIEGANHMTGMNARAYVRELWAFLARHRAGEPPAAT